MTHVLILAFSMLLFAGQAQSKGVDTLVIMKGGSPAPGLALSWKTIGANTIQFRLDMKAKIDGEPITQAGVKQSLEKRLGKVLGLKASLIGSDTIEVVFQGNEKECLDKIAKTKIKRAKSVEIALEGDKTDASIRARTAERKVGDSEVKGAVVSASDAGIEIRIIERGAKIVDAGLGIGKKARFAPVPEVLPEKGTNIFVTPGTLSNGVWQNSAIARE